MVGTTVIRKAECLCTTEAPCDRKAVPGTPGHCSYCFTLDGPCPRTGTPPVAAARPPRVSPRKATKK